MYECKYSVHGIFVLLSVAPEQPLALSTSALDPVILQEEPKHSGELSGEEHGLQLSRPCTLQQPFCHECCQNTGSCC